MKYVESCQLPPLPTDQRARIKGGLAWLRCATLVRDNLRCATLVRDNEEADDKIDKFWGKSNRLRHGSRKKEEDKALARLRDTLM